MTAAALDPTGALVPDAWQLACTLGVLRALEAAGKRGRLPRATVGRLRAAGVPAWEVHLQVRIAARSQDCGRLLEGCWDILRATLPHGASAEEAIAACHDYAVWLLVTQQPFAGSELARYLAGHRDRLPA